MSAYAPLKVDLHVRCVFTPEQAEALWQEYAGSVRPVPVQALAEKHGVQKAAVQAALDGAMRRRGMLR